MTCKLRHHTCDEDWKFTVKHIFCEYFLRILVALHPIFFTVLHTNNPQTTDNGLFHWDEFSFMWYLWFRILRKVTLWLSPIQINKGAMRSQFQVMVSLFVTNPLSTFNAVSFKNINTLKGHNCLPCCPPHPPQALINKDTELTLTCWRTEPQSWLGWQLPLFPVEASAAGSEFLVWSAPSTPAGGCEPGTRFALDPPTPIKKRCLDSSNKEYYKDIYK